MKNTLKIWIILFLLTSPAIAQQDSTTNSITPFHFNHTISKLFAVQTAKVLNSLDLSLLLGGAFGFEGDNGFLGTIAFGLGGYGDLEMSTSSLMTSIFSRDENYGNIALKGKIYSSDDNMFLMSAGMRSNSSWENSTSDAAAIRTGSEESYLAGLRYVDYKWRMTSLYLAATYSKYPNVNLHCGATITDIRFKDGQLYYENGMFYDRPATQKKNLLNFFLGLDKRLNERTTLVAEVLSTPVISVKTSDGTLFVERRYSGSIGLRLFVNRWFILDSSLRYQDDYSGIADTQVRVGLQGIWSIAGN